MTAYAELTGRIERVYRDQLLHLIPPLDRVYLKDFYEKQAAEFEKAKKEAERNAKSRGRA